MVASWIYAFIAVAGLAIYRLSKIGRRAPGLPPGPPTLPFLGNLHLIPKKDPHLQFMKWAQEYGPIYSVTMGTKTTIVLASDTMVKDLLDKRSAIYSSRPEIYLGGIVSGSAAFAGGYRISLMPYGEVWRMLRRVNHSILNIRAARSYVPYQDLENKMMLNGLLDHPDLFVDHIRRYSNSLTTQILLGFRTPSIDDSRLKAVFAAVHETAKLSGNAAAALLDLYPGIRVLPDFLLPARKRANELHRVERELYTGLWLEAKQKVKNGTANPCYCVELAKAQDAEGFSDDLAGYANGVVLEAGSDTTAAELTGFVQAMVVFPEVQKKAHEEIHRVCGDRLPTMEDEPKLQYVRACVKESLRWMPTAILGLPHAVIKDDEYMGYKIPKGATVMLNVWAIHMDPDRYENPTEFDPTRYLDDYSTAMESTQTPDPSKRDHFGFGAGRRVCQGMHIAERSLFIAISRMVWGFRIERDLDADGKEIVPDPGALNQGGLLVQPEPFPARFVPRSEKHAEIMRKEWEDCKELLDDEEQWREMPKGMASSTYEPSVGQEKD